MSITTTKETITPQMAAEYLNHNVKNRRIRKDAVAMIARDIQAGRFRTTHQGIAFYEDGALADGQHRLTAIMKAGVPVEIMVTRGLKRDAMSAIDRGTTRNVADIFAIENNSEDGVSKAIRNTRVVSAISQMCRNGVTPRVKLSASEIEAIFKHNTSECVWIYKIVGTKGGRNSSAINGACLAAMICGVDPTEIVKFMNVYRMYDVTGCDGRNTQAALSLRRAVDEALIQRNRIDGKKLYLMTQNAIWNFVNNTDAHRASAPSAPRYDISDRMNKIIRGE